MNGMHPIFWKILLPKLLPFITHLFNFILTGFLYPDGFEVPKISSIPKSDYEFMPKAIFHFLVRTVEKTY